jgi:hypothetical protein
MQQADIFQPFFGVIILTFAVWFYMYIRRLSFLHTNNVDPAALSTPYRGARVVPENVSLAAFNLLILICSSPLLSLMKQKNRTLWLLKLRREQR